LTDFEMFNKLTDAVTPCTPFDVFPHPVIIQLLYQDRENAAMEKH